MRADAEARFHAFAVSRGPALLRLAWFLTTNQHDAQDLAQNTLVKIFRGWRRVEASRDADAYARRIMLNAATDEHRRRARRPLEQSSDAPVETVDPVDIAGQVASADRLRRLLAELPARQRAVLALRFGEDLSEHDTAVALGISVGTVKSHTARALDRLREIHAREHAEETGNAQI